MFQNELRNYTFTKCLTKNNSRQTLAVRSQVKSRNDNLKNHSCDQFKSCSGILYYKVVFKFDYSHLSNETIGIKKNRIVLNLFKQMERKINLFGNYVRAMCYMKLKSKVININKALYKDPLKRLKINKNSLVNTQNYSEHNNRFGKRYGSFISTQ